VSTILEVHKKYNALVLTAFSNDNGFVASLDKVTMRGVHYMGNGTGLFEWVNIFRQRGFIIWETCLIIFPLRNK
jgi:hypothetical protein